MNKYEALEKVINGKHGYSEIRRRAMDLLEATIKTENTDFEKSTSKMITKRDIYKAVSATNKEVGAPLGFAVWWNRFIQHIGIDRSEEV